MIKCCLIKNYGIKLIVYNVFNNVFKKLILRICTITMYEKCKAMGQPIYELIFFLLHLTKDIPLTFAAEYQKFLKMCITEGARTIIVTFDQYLSPSVKDNERLLRGSKKDRAFYIRRPDQ